VDFTKETGAKRTNVAGVTLLADASDDYPIKNTHELVNKLNQSKMRSHQRFAVIAL
tara:strand:- start:9376 stop:9543 length:168 start_codon:yes stop_codon:yes gene_type:complete